MEPSPRPGLGQSASFTTSRSAPAMRSSTFFSSGTLPGTTARRRNPSTAARAAMLMPVLPEVGSTTPRPPPSTPRSTRSRSRYDAARSLTEPNGFIHSSLAYSVNSRCGLSRLMRTSGVGLSTPGKAWRMLS